MDLQLNDTLSVGDESYKVKPSMFSTNRRRLVEVLKINHNLKPNSAVLLKGSSVCHVGSTNVTSLFHQDSFFNWCFGVEEPGFYGTINITTGSSTLYMPKPKCSEKWKMLHIPNPRFYREKYLVNNCCYTDEIEEYLKFKKTEEIIILTGKDAQSGLPLTEPNLAELGLSDYPVEKDILMKTINELRVIKTKEEICVMKYAHNVTSNAHIEVMRRIRPGWFEYQAESLFKHHIYTFGGCRNTAYIGKIPTGNHASAVEYGTSSFPNNKVIYDGDLCILDMGAEYFGYASVACSTFPVNGKFDCQQKAIYDGVLQIRNKLLESIKPGVSWADMHLLADRLILDHLSKLQLVHGSIDDMMDARVPSVFMPEGLGHFVGLDALDVGGFHEDDPPAREEKGLNRLLTTRILRQGMIITVAPAIFFNITLLDQAFRDGNLNRFLNEKAISKYYSFGGVQIGETIAVTGCGVEVLTKIPRQINEIEVLMAEGQRLDHVPSLLPSPKQKSFDEGI